MTSNSAIRRILKILSFMKITENISKLSYDPKHRVGSIILKKDFTNINAIGFNGNYAGGSNERESMESGMSGFIHAEENALIKSNFYNPSDYMMMVTLKPCDMCAKKIVNSGIKEVIYLRHYDNPNCKSEEIFKTAGVQFYQLNDYIIGLLAFTDILPDIAHLSKSWKNENIEEEVFLNILASMLYKHIKKCYEIDFDKKISKIPNINYMEFKHTTEEQIIKGYLNFLSNTLYELF